MHRCAFHAYRICAQQRAYIYILCHQITFFVANYYLRWPLALSIDASIQVAGHTSMLAGAIHLYQGNVPMHFWPMVVPGLWFGANLGSKMLELLGRLELAAAPHECKDDSKIAEVHSSTSFLRTVFWPDASDAVAASTQRRWNAFILFLLAGSCVHAPNLCWSLKRTRAPLGERKPQQHTLKKLQIQDKEGVPAGQPSIFQPRM